MARAHREVPPEGSVKMPKPPIAVVHRHHLEQDRDSVLRVIRLRSQRATLWLLLDSAEQRGNRALVDRLLEAIAEVDLEIRAGREERTQ